MEFSINMIDVGDADAFILIVRDNEKDFVIFLDAGNTNDGKKVIQHYEAFIKQRLLSNHSFYIINSHPHTDHINGLFDVVEYFKDKIDVAIYNNPMAYVSDKHFDEIRRYATAQYPDEDIVHLYKFLKNMQSFEELLAKYNIPISPAFSDIDYGGLFKILGPSEKYYKSLVDHFTNLNVLLTQTFSPEDATTINEVEEGHKPCEVVDAKNDASPENLSSVLLQLTDNSGKRYLFTGDCGVDSFSSAENNGFSMADFFIAQLPHHGSRRNINTNWICKLNPQQYWVSASGSIKHPRKAVIECIKKNLKDTCRIFSTHKGGSKSLATNKLIFPMYEGWADAIPL